MKYLAAKSSAAVLGLTLSLLLSACDSNSNNEPNPEPPQDQPEEAALRVHLDETDISAEIGQDVWLDASDSQGAEENAELTFFWSGSDHIESPDQAQTWVRNLPLGMHQIELTVTEGEQSETETLTIDVTVPQTRETSGIDTGGFQNPKTVYFNLDTASVVELNEDEAASSDAWHLAFRRTSIFLNHHSTPPVKAHYTGNTNEFYQADGTPNVDRFVNAHADSERDAFNDFSGELAEGAEFHTDQTIASIADFYDYNFATHTVSANPEAHFIVRAHQGYAKFYVSDITQAGRGMAAVEFTYSLQPESSNGFGEWQTLAVTTEGCTEATLVDFASGQTVAEDQDWHIQIPCEQNLGAFALNISPDAHALTGAYAQVDGIDGQNIPANAWQENQTVQRALVKHGNPNSAYGWGEYNLTGQPTLWPNYAIYVIDTGDARFKFQVLDYYDPEDPSSSGHYTVRHQRIYNGDQ